jgi:hypothetical protein
MWRDDLGREMRRRLEECYYLFVVWVQVAIMFYEEL